jgi:hypothetical protein
LFSQVGLVPPQVAPADVLVVVQTPTLAGLVEIAPTQLENALHGLSAVHVLDPTSRRSRQSMSPVDSVLHSCPGAQPDDTHAVPSSGWSSQVPQVAYFMLEQNLDAHWPANVQAAPFARLPGGAQSAGGLAPLSNRSTHDQVAYSAAHFSNWAGLIPVSGAARLFRHANCVRETHVAMSPYVVMMKTPFGLSRSPVSVVPVSVQAWRRLH